MYIPLTIEDVKRLRAQDDLAIEAQMQMLERQFTLWLEDSKYDGE